jgi:hypothetical protein
MYFFNISFYGNPDIYYVCNFLPCPFFVPRSLLATVENKKMSKRKPNWTDRENVVLLEEYEKRSYFESKVFLVGDTGYLYPL